MINKIEMIKEKHNDVLQEIKRLMSISHSQDEYSGPIKSLGGEIEKFLKDGVYKKKSNKKNFNELIEGLSGVGVSVDSVKALHDLRVLYNNFKHNPDYNTDLLSVMKVVAGSLNAVNEIDKLNLGDINSPYLTRQRIILWIVGFQYYTGGMTEVSLLLPDYDVEIPVSFTEFHISFQGWDQIIKKYETRGALKMGKEHISDKAYAIWQDDFEFAGAGKFDGDVKELIEDLASFVDKKREGELLSFLRRENDTASVKAAIVFSIYDSFKHDQWNSFEELKDEIQIRTDYDYGISIDSQLITRYLLNLNPDIQNISRSMLREVEIIRWLDEQGYNKEKIVIDILCDLSTSINTKKEIVCRIK